MTTAILPLLVAFQRAIDKTVILGGVGVPVMLGYPDLGRTDTQLPVVCVLFTAETSDSPRPVTRLGSLPSVQLTVQAMVYTFARSEQELLGLVDTVRGLKDTLSHVSIESTVFNLRWGASRRVNQNEEERQLGYAVATEIALSLQH